MKSKKTTRRALLTSMLSLLICVSMLVGSTFAWFTDSVTSQNNIIKSGNLDVELEYYDGDSWEKVTEKTNVFEENTLWEPGHTEVVYLKVSNLGTLALKYQLGVNIASETEGTNVAKETFKLSDYIEFGTIESGAENFFADRDAARKAVTDGEIISVGYTKNGVLYPVNDTQGAAVQYVALVVYMPEETTNVANYLTGTDAPVINLGIELFATQVEAEEDSFGNDYDKEAPVLTFEVTPATAQDYLDGKYGSLNGNTLIFTPGNYGHLILGRATAYEGSNTVYTCPSHGSDFASGEEYAAHMADTSVYHGTSAYETTLKNVTFKAEDGASVAGLTLSAGHVHGAATEDHVRGTTGVSANYYQTVKVSGLTFEGFAFTGKVDINSSDADSTIRDISFLNCSFTTGGTASANSCALRFYNENNNGQMSGLTVADCAFTNCYQGVYTANINGITVKDSSFDTTGHNAIAVQSTVHGAVDHGKVTITGNTFKKIADRIIRFGDVGAGTEITIQYNKATDSGDENGEVIKATSIAAGVKTDVKYNDWGSGKVVANPELQDTEKASLAMTSADFKSAATGNSSDPSEVRQIVVMDQIKVEDLTYVNFAAPETVINGNGNSLVRDTASGNPLLVNTTNKVTFENVVFESTKGSAVLATRKEGANIEVNDCVFQNNAAPSTGNTGVQVYASNVTMVFNRCTFNNMPVITNSSYPEGIKLVFNNCTFNWVGDNCPGFLQIANNLKITVDFNNCKFTYKTDSQYTTAKTMISYNWPEASTININGLEVVGTRNNDNIWKIASPNNKVTINTSGELSYTFNGADMDFATYLK